VSRQAQNLTCAKPPSRNNSEKHDGLRDLLNGALYAQFPSKEALTAEALAYGLDRSLTHMTASEAMWRVKPSGPSRPDAKRSSPTT